MPGPSLERLDYVKSRAPELPLIPDASIVIPAYNEEATIAETILAIHEAANHSMRTTGKKIELICVDNNSSDHTAQIAEDCGVRVVVEDTKGVSYARQAGHESAEADIILQSDADTQVPLTWIDAHMRHYANPDLAGLTGKFKYDSVHPFYKCYQFARIFWRGGLAVKRAFRGEEKPVSFFGVNFSYRKDRANEFGGFDLGSNKGEDVIFGHELAKAGDVLEDRSKEICVQTSGRRYRGTAQVSAQILFDVSQTLRRNFTNIPTPRGRDFVDIREYEEV